MEPIRPDLVQQVDGKVGHPKDLDLNAKLQTVRIEAEANTNRQVNDNAKVKIHREVYVQVDDLPFDSSGTKEEATNTDSNIISGRIIRPSKVNARDRSRSKSRRSRTKTLAFIESSDAEDYTRSKGKHRNQRDAQMPENSHFAFSSSIHGFNKGSPHRHRSKTTSPPDARHRTHKTLEDCASKYENRQRAKSNERRGTENRYRTATVTENDIRFIPAKQGRFSTYPSLPVHLRGGSVSPIAIYSREPQKTDNSSGKPKDSTRRGKMLSIPPVSDNDEQKERTKRGYFAKEMQEKDAHKTRQAWWELPPTPESELGPRVRGLSIASFDPEFSDNHTARFHPKFAQNLAERKFRDTNIRIDGEGESGAVNPASRLLNRFRSAIEAIDETLWV